LVDCIIGWGKDGQSSAVSSNHLSNFMLMKSGFMEICEITEIFCHIFLEIKITEIISFNFRKLNVSRYSTSR
jgi:hypothetical protein